MTYTEKLKSPEWQKKRLKILERDGWICSLCRSSAKELHVHHRYYVSGRQPWEYPDSCYQTLCKFCHDKINPTELQPFERLLGTIPANDGTYISLAATLCQISADPKERIAILIALLWDQVSVETAIFNVATMERAAMAIHE